MAVLTSKPARKRPAKKVSAKRSTPAKKKAPVKKSPARKKVVPRTKPKQRTPAKKTEGKRGGGRPSDYHSDYCDEAKKLCMLLFATDEQLAAFFEVSVVTLNAWKKALALAASAVGRS